MECPHGMPSRASCIDCMADGPVDVPKKEPVRVMYRFIAQYDGHCSPCNLAIHVGQRVVKLSTDAVIHDHCWVTNRWDTL